MKIKHLESVDHNYLRYANCWEDADVLLDQLDVVPGDRVLSIGSAGDNCFSLLTGQPELVLAVDVNPVQLALIGLKKAAIKTLDYEAFLEFLGFKNSDRREELFARLRSELSPQLQTFWSGKINDIKAGLIYQGKFEKYFALFRKKVLPWIHSKKRVQELFLEKTEVTQERYYQSKWNNFRWKKLFKIFFSKFVMGRLGRDPEFLAEVGVPVSEFIYKQAESQLKSSECQKNYFLDFILRGNFSTGLPHYAREENFRIIKSNIHKLVIKQGYAQEIAAEYSGINKFNLSNIFEYMDTSTFKEVVGKLVSNAAAGARFAYWNLMVPRRMSVVNSSLGKEFATAKNDMGFFYSDFHLNEKL